MIVVPFVILGLAYFLLRTDAGVAVRAAAENADRALLLGIPVRRLATIVWALAGGLSALTFVLKAPFSGVVPGVANGPDGVVARPGGRGRRPYGVTARCVRRGSRPRHRRANRAVELARVRRRSSTSPTSS